ncbi:hypothetical protein SCHPADRAFT_823888 [Schizopora paradoxa]|uniref:REM-1 domain-containing protein n=1 Tax=Schizopora paradoxa TaxID=27342 RepID=A0A0H2S2J7_9AGAM|nr:hypothetical protein SCHPADRAFT_823888 [Schizopora paradoxa]
MFTELDGKSLEDQIQTLQEMLAKAQNLKRGAEGVLKPDLPNIIKARIEGEMAQADAQINSIVNRMDSCAPLLNPKCERSDSVLVSSHARDTRSTSLRDGGPSLLSGLKTTKQQVSGLIKALLNPSLHKNSVSSVSSSSSSLGAQPSDTAGEFDNVRSEVMKQLCTILEGNDRVRFDLNMVDLVQAISPALADNASSKMRARAYRLLRHTLVDMHSVGRLLEQNLDWYLVRSLARDNRCSTEREQVIKLVRSIVEIGSENRPPHASAGLGTVPLSEAVMRALIAVAEHQEDPFNIIVSQTLTEILLIDVDLLERTGGLRVLLQALVDGPAELAPIVTSAFLQIMDIPKSRVYLNPGTDLDVALSGITDAYGKGTHHGDRMRVSAKVISVILRTWSGLMYLCMNDMAAIRTMVDTLRIPTLETREIILDMFFDLLNIKTPEWYKTFIDGKRLTIYRRRPPSQPKHTMESTASKAPENLKLTDQYISLLIIVLTKAGLLDALTAMLEEVATGSSLSRKATLLIAEILQTANKSLPVQYASHIQSITRIFELAVDYNNGDHRIVGTGAISSIESFNRHQARFQTQVIVKDARQRANSVEDPVRRGQRQAEQVRVRTAMQMDDKAFQSALIDTQVMMSRDFKKWNHEILLGLVEGPLLNPKRLEEAIKVSKFVKRLMSFFHPFSQLSNRFADIERNEVRSTVKWVKLGCSLLSTLLANPDGVKYLASEEEFLPQIVKGFNQLDPVSVLNASDAETVFSKKKIEETLTYGYLEMLGTLSKHREGVELLEKFKIFSALYQVSNLKSRDDLVKGIIDNIDYSIDGHSRIVLSKMLTSAYKHIREYATIHLGQLIRSSPKVNAWMLRLLVTQLYDPDQNVCQKAVQFLEEVCDSPENLKVVVDMQPTLEHLGEVANSLLYKFMSTPLGFRYLYDVGFIERELDAWLYGRNENYVVEIEVYLSRELNYNPMEDEPYRNFEGTAPRHFYGEIAKTEFGCQILHEKGHFEEFAYFIRTHGFECEDFEIIHKLKSILWVIGHVGASPGGLHFLEEDNLIPIILEIAELSAVLSVRGTCFYALGLISSTAPGAEILDDDDWESTLSPLGVPTGLCYPSNVEKFVAVDPWDVPPPEDQKTLIPPTVQEEVDILAAISNLANTVIANAASRTLAKMKSKPEYRNAFSSCSLFYRVLDMLSTQRFRLPVRRYILDLFDIQLDADVVLELAVCAQKLQAPGNTQSPKITKLKPRVVSTFGRPGRGRNPSDSSDDDESMDSEEEPIEIVVERPVSLLPVRKVKGFMDSPISNSSR